MTELHANPENFDLYALGALDGEEKLAFETHLGACPACRQQLAAAKSRVALMGLAAPPIAPPPAVKLALIEKVRAEQAATAKNSAPVKTRKIRWGLRFSLGFAAATAILALCTFELWKLNSQREQQIAQLQTQIGVINAELGKDSAAMQAMGEVTGAPDSAQVTLLEQPGGPPGQAHVLYNARIGVGLYSGQIAPAPAGKSYQLWLVPEAGAPIDAGLVSPNQQNGAVVIRLTPGLAPKAFAVTLEPLGGMPQPTGPKVLVGVAGA